MWQGMSCYPECRKPMKNDEKLHRLICQGLGMKIGKAPKCFLSTLINIFVFTQEKKTHRNKGPGLW